MTAAYFAMRVLISASSDRLLSIVEPRSVKLSTASSVTLSMLIDGGETMPRPITYVFLMLTVSVLALNRAWLNNSLPSALVCWKTPSVDVLKTYDSIMEKNYAK